MDSSVNHHAGCSEDFKTVSTKPGNKSRLTFIEEIISAGVLSKAQHKYFFQPFTLDEHVPVVPHRCFVPVTKFLSRGSTFRANSYFGIHCTSILPQSHIKDTGLFTTVKNKRYRSFHQNCRWQITPCI